MSIGVTRFSVARLGGRDASSGLLAAVLALVLTLSAGAQTAALAADTAAPAQTPEQMEADCWFQFMESDSKEIACAFPTLMEPEDRESIRKLTRQLFQDARCMVTVKLERELIEAAVREPNVTFLAPPQPVSCEVLTSRGTLPISFTFKPRIEIKDGKAVKATPGMGDVVGVNSWLAWPVVAYINASGSISDIMLRVANAYLERRRSQAQQP